MRYIITGHLGQIGKEFKKRIDLEKNVCVGAYDIRGGATTQSLPYTGLETDVLFHLAANCKINESVYTPSKALQNIFGISDTLEFCRKHNTKMVYFSSSRVLSKERNPYVASKIFGEELCKAYNECYGVEYITIRPSTVYGAEDETGRLFDIWMKNALTNKPLIIYGDPMKTLNFTHIDDFLDATDLILKYRKSWGNTFNVYGIEAYLEHVATEIIEQTNSKSEIIFREPEIAQPQKVNLFDKKLYSLGYSPKISIKEGISKYLNKPINNQNDKET